ncbi:caspase family protein [Duganella vulcania]|uniref:Peptidase C14 caspase domain-containing protein n=1 Tax=Duganella vulcania TaxID=2692166 RepID=A0A845GTH1_9BURK|nr:caspase family protein [Duganella vulcania]MYM97584.1 hypothetical protein [Duganella vulcania]
MWSSVNIFLVAMLGSGAAALAADQPVLEPQSGHRIAVTRMAFAAGDSLLVTADHTGTMLVWNHASGLSRDFTPSSAATPGYAAMLVNEQAGSIALIPYNGGKPGLIGLADGRPTPGRIPPLQRFALSPDQARVAGLTADGRLALFDARTWQALPLPGAACAEPLAAQPGDSYGNLDFMFHPDGRRLMIATGNGAVLEVDLQHGCRVTVALAPRDHPHLVVALSPRADAVALAYQGRLDVVRFDRNAAPATALATNDGLRRLLFTPDGKGLLMGISDGVLGYTDLASHTTRHWKFAEDLTGLAVSARGDLAAAGLMSGAIRMVSLGAAGERDISARVLTPVAAAAQGSGAALTVRTDTEVWRLDLERARIALVYRADEPNRYVDMDQDGQAVWSASQAGGATVLRAGEGWARHQVHPAVPMYSWAAALAPDGKSVAVSYGAELRVYDAAGGSFVVVGKLPHPATRLEYSQDGAWLAAVGEAQAFGLIRLADKTQYALVAGADTGTAFAYSADGRQLAFGQADGSVRFFDLVNARTTPRRIDGQGKVSALRFSADGQRLAIGRGTGEVDLVDLPSLQKLPAFTRLRSTVNSLVFLPPGLLVAIGLGGEIRVASVAGRSDLASLYLLPDGQWMAATPDGRFDMSDSESLAVVSWRMPDDPLRPLPPEVFMRDFYEPRLIPRLVARLLACEAGKGTDPAACAPALAPVRPLASLNRIQPGVRIAAVRRGATALEALVDVEVSAVSDPTQPNGKQQTGVYDLRLFRDGQLVRQLPDNTAADRDGADWADNARIAMAPGQSSAIKRFAVRLAGRNRGLPVKLSAYAFNEDRVKSATVVDDRYLVPADAPAARATAYVIAVGADSYDAPERTLRFAASDARAMSRALAGLKGYRVVPVTLVSEGKDASAWKATRANIRAVLARLAGGPGTGGELAGVANADALAPATPDDLVILSFSGHGYTSKQGKFYLLPSDSGSGLPIDAQALSRFISSDDLSDWLRPVDAGQIAMIIDACHAAGSVDQPGFKPGPMGDRGLGQLAYDKNMRILAASQADDVALESGVLLQGLLTYALVGDGLRTPAGGVAAADADRDGSVTLAEWLRYGEARVPGLYEEIRRGRVGVSNLKDPIVDEAFRSLAEKRAQTPALFDFARTAPRVEVLVTRATAGGPSP